MRRALLLAALLSATAAPLAAQCVIVSGGPSVGTVWCWNEAAGAFEQVSTGGGGVDTDDQTAPEVPILDAPGNYTGANVEAALQEAASATAQRLTQAQADALYAVTGHTHSGGGGASNVITAAPGQTTDHFRVETGDQPPKSEFVVGRDGSLRSTLRSTADTACGLWYGAQIGGATSATMLFQVCGASASSSVAYVAGGLNVGEGRATVSGSTGAIVSVNDVTARHLKAGGITPSVACAGAAVPTPVGGDSFFEFTVGGAAVDSCVVTLGTAHTTPPICVPNGRTVPLRVSTATTSTLTIAAYSGTIPPGEVVGVHCGFR